MTRCAAVARAGVFLSKWRSADAGISTLRGSRIRPRQCSRCRRFPSAIRIRAVLRGSSCAAGAARASAMFWCRYVDRLQLVRETFTSKVTLDSKASISSPTISTALSHDGNSGLFSRSRRRLRRPLAISYEFRTAAGMLRARCSIACFALRAAFEGAIRSTQAFRTETLAIAPRKSRKLLLRSHGGSHAGPISRSWISRDRVPFTQLCANHQPHSLSAVAPPFRRAGTATAMSARECLAPRLHAALPLADRAVLGSAPPARQAAPSSPRSIR